MAYTDAINLKHDQKDLSFDFVALHYLQSKDNLYSWKLEDYDTEWTPASKERQASYTNLSPGTYTFRVKGSNADGIWNEEGASIAISINPPWWATWWAYLGYFIIVAGGVFAIYGFQLQRRLQRAEAIRIKELDAVKTRLYTNITHEFRTPLTVILGMAQQVLENPKEHLKEGLAMVIRNGQNLLSLINQILDLSKLESGKLNLIYQQVDSIAFLRYIAESFHSMAEIKGVQIHFLSGPESLLMDIDEVRLQQIVSNLLSNAIKFTQKGGHIYLSTRTGNGVLIITIKDTGIGISEADIPHIFDRFYQADGSHTRRDEGTGIGLALTRELIRLMKGSITVKSTKGKGSEFEITLPISHNAALLETKKVGSLQSAYLHADDRIQKEAVSVASMPSTFYVNDKKKGKKPLVLIADDNEDVRCYIVSCLQKDYAIAIAKNGRECEEMAFDTTPDLIVLDVMMPFKDGFEVCSTLKNDRRTSHIPVIMLTAKADMDSRLQGLEQRADAYLTKPFHKKELILRIKNLLELRQLLQQYYRSSLEIGSLEVDTPDEPTEIESQRKISGSNGSQYKVQNQSILLGNSMDNSFVIKVKKIIEAHLDDINFDVEKLCREIALSHSQVHRKLVALTGLSATYFIRYIRLLKAKELLLHSGFKISAISSDCGFNDPAYFSRVFKKEFDLTPQQWRDQNSVS